MQKYVDQDYGKKENSMKIDCNWNGLTFIPENDKDTNDIKKIEKILEENGFIDKDGDIPKADPVSGVLSIFTRKRN